ncbi:glycosyltransferase family 4 protein [candidate division WWE3 bacterium]|nr:glycosyltransferase family 4 protein [candidate division WWE3 bacterium]
MRKNIQKILWANWKDIGHPQAGGAEFVNHEIARRLVADGYFVTLLTSLYDGAAEADQIDGVQVVRIGKSRYLHTFQALYYYLRYLRGQYDLIVESVNTAPYMIGRFLKGEKLLLFYHQLAHEVWFHQTTFPLSSLGYYVLEPVATALNVATPSQIVTISESTKKDLVHHGFSEKRIHIISEAIGMEPIANLSRVIKPTKRIILALGAIRSMKRTDEIIKAFEIAKRKYDDLELILAGRAEGNYGQSVLEYIGNSPYSSDITYLGHITDYQKQDLLKRAYILCGASIKEGWGLTVTEANSQGTPAIVYNVDGLRDSVKHDETGIICMENSPESMAAQILLLLDDRVKYKKLQKNAWEMSKSITPSKSYADFRSLLESM